MLSSLYVLDAMAQTGRSLSSLIDWLYETVGPHQYDRLDLEFPAALRADVMGRVSESQPAELAGVAVTDISTSDGYRFMLGGRLMAPDPLLPAREPLLRIYAEARSMERVQRLIGAGRALTGI